MTASIAVGICFTITLAAQEQSGLAVAKAMDGEITRLHDLPDEARGRAIDDLVLRIRKQPREYAIALANNLAISATEASGADTLQRVATTLADAIRNAPPKYRHDAEYTLLARLASYYHMQVSLEDDPKYAGEISRIEAETKHRSMADFTLSDLQGHQWNLRSLAGKVVLVNFWATWCPPCRREIPDMSALYERFGERGLVILAITDEDVSKIKPFVSQEEVRFPILLDPEQKVKNLFRVDGIPQSFLYDREGRLVAQVLDRPSMQGFLKMLAQAGLQ